MMPYIEIYALGLILVNLFVFILLGIDKSKAKKRQYRIPERTLLVLGTISGGIGGLLGMKVFRHKTKHSYFYKSYLIGLVIWIFMFYFALN